MPDAETSESLTILVVDDEPAMVGVLGALLGRAGHHIACTRLRTAWRPRV